MKTVMTRHNTDIRSPRCLKLYYRWAALYQVDIHISGRDVWAQHERRVQNLAWQLVYRGEDGSGGRSGGDSDVVSQHLVAAVALAVEECMQTKIAQALGWTTTVTTTRWSGAKETVVFKPAHERVWPPWTKGWLRDDWDGRTHEPTEGEKRRIARWWAREMLRQERSDDGYVSDSDAAAQSHARQNQVQFGRRLDEESHGRNHVLDSLLQDLYPGRRADQDAVMQTLLFGQIGGDGDVDGERGWTRYDWQW